MYTCYCDILALFEYTSITVIYCCYLNIQVLMGYMCSLVHTCYWDTAAI